jgi:hypothetical protein
VRGRRVGHVSLGESRDAVRRALGDPRSSRKDVDRWCVVGGAGLRVAYLGKERRVVLATTTARGQTVRGVGRGTKARVARRRLRVERSRQVGETKVFLAMKTASRIVVAGIRHGRVAWIGLADPRHSGAATLRRAGIH